MLLLSFPSRSDPVDSIRSQCLILASKPFHPSSPSFESEHNPHTQSHVFLTFSHQPSLGCIDQNKTRYPMCSSMPTKAPKRCRTPEMREIAVLKNVRRNASCHKKGHIFIIPFWDRQNPIRRTGKKTVSTEHHDRTLMLQPSHSGTQPCLHTQDHETRHESYIKHDSRLLGKRRDPPPTVKFWEKREVNL